MSPLLPKDKVEAFVIDRLEKNILNKDNLEELVRLTNEELSASHRDDEERLQKVQMQIDDTKSRLRKSSTTPWRQGRLRAVSLRRG